MVTGNSSIDACISLLLSGWSATGLTPGPSSLPPSPTTRASPLRPPPASDGHRRRFDDEDLAVVPFRVGCEQCPQLLVLAVLLRVGGVLPVVRLRIEDHQHDPLAGVSLRLQDVVGDEPGRLRGTPPRPPLVERLDRLFLPRFDLHPGDGSVHDTLLSSFSPIAPAVSSSHQTASPRSPWRSGETRNSRGAEYGVE